MGQVTSCGKFCSLEAQFTWGFYLHCPSLVFGFVVALESHPLTSDKTARGG